MSGAARRHRGAAVIVVAMGCLAACLGNVNPPGESLTASDAGADGAELPDVADATLDSPSVHDAGDAADAALADGVTTCGPSGNESCAMSLLVPGGTFFRSYDGVTYADNSYPATVSSFRLDKYEITVGRFRKFVAAVAKIDFSVPEPRWEPPVGSGKHAHLNGGSGLNGGTESGWDATWTEGGGPWYFAGASEYGWDLNLSDGTWTKGPDAGAPAGGAGANENLPITNISWFEAYAFCIWDGGFLPTEAEWNYAASGGAEQRQFPWSDPQVDCSHASYAGGPVNPGDGGVGGGPTACSPTVIDPVGTYSPKGDGRWGHADLAANVAEWVLDAWLPQLGNPSIDGANLDRVDPWYPAVVRGGQGNVASPATLRSSYRTYYEWYLKRSPGIGARCARAP